MTKKFVKMVKCPDGKNRIKALCDFATFNGSWVAAGQIGGIIHQKPKGRSWVCEDSEVVQELIDSEVWNSKLMGSAPNEKIENSIIEGCTSEPIGGFSAYSSDLYKSVFCNSYVKGSEVKSSTLNEVNILDCKVKKSQLNKVKGERCTVNKMGIQDVVLQTRYIYKKGSIKPIS